MGLGIVVAAVAVIWIAEQVQRKEVDDRAQCLKWLLRTTPPAPGRERFIGEAAGDGAECIILGH